MLLFEEQRIQRAIGFAGCAHRKKPRKYTNEPYVVHCIAVGELLARYLMPHDVICAGILHDIIEDTEVTFEEIEKLWGERIAKLVLEVTDVSKSTDGNRTVRKALDRAHVANSSKEGASIKLADLIDNTSSIVQHDVNFARIYLKEKEALLEVLKHGNSELWNHAHVALVEAKQLLEASLLP